MAASPTVNAALLHSLQRARDPQSYVNVVSPSYPQNNVPYNSSPIETITTGPIIKNTDQSNSKPSWNSSSVAQPTKTSRSVFLDNNVPRQIYPTATTIRPVNNTEVTTPVKVVRLPTTIMEEPSNRSPVYIQYPQQTYPTNTKLIRTEPQVIVLDSQSNEQSLLNYPQRNNKYSTRYYPDTDILYNQPKSSVYRYCQCCARGRLASRCPSCYFCELFYGCPLYCWILTLLLLLLPMLAIFGWLISEQPAINPAKRQYITEQSSIVQNDVYAVMHNCAVPYCTNASPSTTINQLYLTYHDYSATQITSNGNIFQTFSLIFFGLLYILIKLCEI
ncbi:unnamed protein product [Rotaria sordida]|uniref:Uncharacterized protein n=1 Tax=Rotaria sordida TaxID=392033 RepID=A0A818T494_9BILA|nr:unnamed protein product [Rotaria sordida]CAF3681564.1 unnamed protein product [Rotaria sordida]